MDMSKGTVVALLFAWHRGLASGSLGPERIPGGGQSTSSGAKFARQSGSSKAGMDCPVAAPLGPFT